MNLGTELEVLAHFATLGLEHDLKESLHRNDVQSEKLELLLENSQNVIEDLRKLNFALCDQFTTFLDVLPY